MAAATLSKSHPSAWSRLIFRYKPFRTPNPHHSRTISTFSHIPSPTDAKSPFPGKFQRFFSGGTVYDLLKQVEEDRARERTMRLNAGLSCSDIDAEEEEDYMGISAKLEKLQKENLKDAKDGKSDDQFEEPTDSESDDDERYTPEALQKQSEIYDKKCKRFNELMRCYTKSGSIDEAFKWMSKIDKFEKKHFQIRPEYRVMGELINRLKTASGKDKFLLQQKLNRAMRLVQWKENFDPNNPANYGIIQHEGSSVDILEMSGFQREKRMIEGADQDDVEEEFDDMKEKEAILLRKLDAIDKILEEKLAALEHTFGKKGKVLEEEIRNLAEERNSLTEKKRMPLYRKGFDVKLIDVNRTCKVTKGGQLVKYTVMLACGNYHGVVGFAKAKGPKIPIALQKAHEKCFQNLHYVDRYEEHTIAHAVQMSYKKTKIYLWPASTTTGMKAGKTVQTILNLAGYRNVKSKVIGSRNPHNTVKALFKALNAIETPKDVQEKLGRTVVESYLL